MKAKLKPRINTEGRPALETIIPLATPLVIFVDPASACNFKCVFCPTGHRDTIADTGRFQGLMSFDVFKKVVDDLIEFESPVKVLRLYKDGEPFLNKRLADMVSYAKKSGCVDVVDTTTNASLITPERIGPVLDAGLDKINISIEGMTSQQYQSIAGVKFDFAKLVENVKWLYAHRGKCEVCIKIINETVTPDERRDFFATFGDYCDRIFVENFAPCWPEFDVKAFTGAEMTTGLYGQDIVSAEVCPYIFYGYSVNADGLVSACFIDWARKLIIGDVRKQSMRDIWSGAEMNKLRLMHLEGKRKQNPVCGSCGQLSHCGADNIDKHREALLDKFKASIAL